MEARGVEPLSENLKARASPSAVYVLGFPPSDSHKQDSGFGSFINADSTQSFVESVPCLYDADCLRRRRLRVDGSRVRRLRVNCCYSQLLFIPILWQFGAAARFSRILNPRRNQIRPRILVSALSRASCARFRAPRRAFAYRRACRSSFCPCTPQAALSFARPSGIRSMV